LSVSANECRVSLVMPTLDEVSTIKPAGNSTNRLGRVIAFGERAERAGWVVAGFLEAANWSTALVEFRSLLENTRVVVDLGGRSRLTTLFLADDLARTCGYFCMVSPWKVISGVREASCLFNDSACVRKSYENKLGLFQFACGAHPVLKQVSTQHRSRSYTRARFRSSSAAATRSLTRIGLLASGALRECEDIIGRLFGNTLRLRKCHLVNRIRVVASNDDLVRGIKKSRRAAQRVGLEPLRDALLFDERQPVRPMSSRRELLV